MKNKQKISTFLIISLLLVFSVLSVIPTGSASYVVIASQLNGAAILGNMKHVHPSDDAGVPSAAGNSFAVTADGYLDYIEVVLSKQASPTGSISCEIWGVQGALDAETPNATLYESSSLWIESIGSQEWYTFEFTDTLYMQTDQRYVLVVKILSGSVDGSNYINMYGHNVDDSTGNAMYFINGNWNPDDTSAFVFRIIGDTVMAATPTPAPTASPTPSPTPFTYQGDIWAALSPYANILLPLVLIVFIALLCGKYGGVWGFFAGLNVTAILVYAIMGASYMPLWGLVMLALVDGLLLFGKISGRM